MIWILQNTLRAHQWRWAWPRAAMPLVLGNLRACHLASRDSDCLLTSSHQPRTESRMPFDALSKPTNPPSSCLRLLNLYPRSSKTYLPVRHSLRRCVLKPAMLRAACPSARRRFPSPTHTRLFEVVAAALEVAPISSFHPPYTWQSRFDACHCCQDTMPDAQHTRRAVSNPRPCLDAPHACRSRCAARRNARDKHKTHMYALKGLLALSVPPLACAVWRLWWPAVGEEGPLKVHHCRGDLDIDAEFGSILVFVG
ncbi:hypothetical protein BJV78DRAFT_512745 [Lactifluus subvellereus]|nr:hypothetical protein BJV78DRAFT_512745 [Lactifluus subvellereus]